MFNEEGTQCKNLVMKYCDIFNWSNKNLKAIPPKVVQHTIFLILNAKSICEKSYEPLARTNNQGAMEKILAI